MTSPDRDRPGTSRPPKPKREAAGLQPRRAALDLLRRVRSGELLDEALGSSREFSELEGPDRAFAHTLAMTVLRRQGTLDALYEPFLDRPLRPNQHEVRALLRLAVAQIALLKTPPHAAGSTSVDLARDRRDTAGFGKLINALSRKIAEKAEEALPKVSIRADTPGWLWRKMERAYGPQTARAIAEAHRVEPPFDVTIREESDKEILAEEIDAAPIGPFTMRRAGVGRVQGVYGFAEGRWWVQDLAASLPVALAGNVEGKRVLDLCAAPGGKTLQFASRGANVTSLDIAQKRVRKLEDNLRRTKLEANVLVADILQWEPLTPYDVVLLDAPCSATGTIRRHPDLLWGKREDDVAKLVRLQAQMVDRAANWVAPGGLFIFVTCSLLPEEGEEQAARIKSTLPGFTHLPISSEEELSGLPVVNKEGDLRCLPSRLADKGGMDGFFAARFRKDA